MNGLARKALIGVLFALPILPLIVIDGLFFPFITGKAFFFRMLVEVAVALFIYLLVTDKRYRLQITPLNIVFGAFVVVMFLADLLGVHVVRSIWSNFERMEGWITLVHLWGLLIVFEHVLHAENLWRRFLQMTLGVSVAVGLYGILQLMGVFTINQGGVRLDATLGNATYLAVYALFHVFLAGIAYVQKPSRNALWLYGGIALLNALILYFTATRGALLGLAVGVVVTLGVYAFLRKDKKVGALLVAVLLLGVGTFGVLRANKDAAWVAESPTLARIATISPEAGETRFTIWGMALQGVAERPVLGWGQGNFTPIFAKYYDPELYDQEPWFDRAHNVFIDWLVAGGVIGALLYILLYVLAGYVVVRGKGPVEERALLIGLLAAYTVHNLFVFDHLVSYFLFVLLLAYCARVYGPVVREVAIPKVSPIIAGAVVGVVAVLGVYALNVPALQANMQLLRALNPTLPLEARLAAFVDAGNGHPIARQESAEQMSQVAPSIAQAQIPVEAKQAFFSETLTQLEAQTNRMAASARIRLLYGSTLRTAGLLPEAEEVLTEAKELAPRKQDIIISLGITKLLAGNVEGARAEFEEAYTLAPGYTRAAEAYASGLVYTQDFDAAEAFIAERFSGNLAAHQSVIRAYVDVEAGEQARAILEAQDTSPEQLTAIATVQFLSGNQEEALATIEELIFAYPSYAQEARAFLEQIQSRQ